MRKRKLRKSKKLLALGGLLVVVVVASVLAYFYSSVVLNNPFSTKAYGGAMVENYTPKNNWEPGMTVPKIVSVENTGNYDLFVRVKMEESWKYGILSNFFTLNSISPLFYMTAYTDTIASGGTVVYKELNIAMTDNWTLYPTDGYFYYEYKLKPGESTQSLLESVTLASKASMGDYTVKTYYKLNAGDSWVEVTTDNPLPATYAMIKSESVLTPETGYANAFYTLTITTELVQANAQAAGELSPLWPTTVIPLPTAYAPTP